MNNLIQIREKIKQNERLQKAKLIATKNGEFPRYRRSVYQERKEQAKRLISNEDL